ncbi:MULTISPECIES: spore germination protein [Caproicibacterium]|jgi:spore germination protein KA|uniref:Spore germination protein n=1 Tax=Caproicibacterium lactatifermentans TaxID=2666138 RepID=A0ABX6PWW8_9FIRM|nr:spore germination protein [Caproicibacterium lactatifermentans]QKO30733.1 spore germination protein [Caproicibacterium lactatifermentans]
MIQAILKKIRYWQLIKNSNNTDEKPVKKEKKKLSLSLSTNIKWFKELLGKSDDIKVREFTFGNKRVVNAALIFIDGLVSNEIITESIMKPLLLYDESLQETPTNNAHDLMNQIQRRVLCSGDVTANSYVEDLVTSCLRGDTVLLLDGTCQGLVVSSKGWDKRSVTEPQTESVARGPREGFTENFRTNTSLLRRKIRSPALRMDSFTIGEKTHTMVCVAYLKGVADEKLIEEIKRRLNTLKVDAILESGYIEQYIEDAPFSLFPTIGKSEKPDVIAGKILEGRAAIIVDGTPFVLTAPMLFTESFQTAEDYYSRTLYASAIRLMRFLSFLIAVFAPAFYVAATIFHQEMIPTKLLFTIAAAREGTPFPAVVESLILLLAFEVLREAGLRLPRPVGQAVSIVGALVMGDASISAGLVGAPVVVTVAISAMAEFVTPENQDSITLLRLIFLLLSAALGGYGIMLGTLGMLIDLASLESFGVPYFAGIAPAHSHDMEDLFVRAPLWSMTERPPEFARKDRTRQKGSKPPFFHHKS